MTRLELTCAIAGLILLAVIVAASARDNGRFAGADPEIKSWFDHLASGKGLCCSYADGESVADIDWEVAGDHYRVRLGGNWIEVPDDAVITAPNRIGHAVVWPIRLGGEITIRCFMPSALS